ncbi:hypothetical protein [Geminicoccus roseus]|uniref:hypothetical protein n=1 Tax=Geminicoccus roseus TaxID=404900 RepID=UPI0012FAE2DC|nr:hypothetical protein [Geminicoccus roseus]
MIRNWFTNGIKWAAGFVLVPALLAMIGGGGIWLYQYVTYDRHLSQIQGSAKFKGMESEYCTQQDYPISVIFINNSTKTIEQIEFYLEARYKGRSRNLASNNRRIDDSITGSKDFSGLC